MSGRVARAATVLIALIAVPSAQAGDLGPEPTSPEVLIAKAKTPLGVHFRVTAYTYGERGDVWVIVRERSESSSGTSTGAGLTPACGKAGIAGIGYTNLLDEGPRLVASGQVKPGVKRVSVTLKARKRRARTREPQVHVMPRESAEVLGVERSGWWFTDFARPGEDRRLRVGAARRNGRLIQPFSTWNEADGFRCSDGSIARPARR